MRRILSLRRQSRGQTLVEFALVLPIIIVLTIGAVDFARGVFIYNTLSESARQGARMAIVDQNPDVVADTAVAYAPATGLTPAGVSVCFKTESTLLVDCTSGADVCTPLRPGCKAIVEVTLDYQPITPVIAEIVGPLTLTSTSIMSIEYACTGACP